jgi:transcriptional regulator with XRE-family HTH domain
MSDPLSNETESLGKYLQKVREARKVSLKEVSKNIKVREQFLKAVEEDRHDLFPSPPYAKGFLSAYAKYLGLDPNQIILRYEKLLKGESITREEKLPEKRRAWHKRYLWIMGGVILAGFVIVYLLFFSPPKSPVEPVSPRPETKEILPAPSSPAVEKPPVAEEKPMTIELKAVAMTWVSVQLDDQPEKDIILRSGEGISYRAMKRIELMIGNAGGLDLIFNDRSIERIGKPGEVFTVIFTSQGMETKRREKPKPLGE